VRLPDFVRTTTVRWAFVVWGIYALALILSFSFVYMRASSVVTASADSAITDEADAIAREAPDRRLEVVAERMRQDPRRVKPVGIFDPSGHLIKGNIAALPTGLTNRKTVQDLPITRLDEYGREEQMARAAVRYLEDDRILVVAWFVDYNLAVLKYLRGGLAISLIPTLLLGLAGGLFLSRRSQKRIEEMNSQVRHIIAGDLRRRLPAHGTSDPFDKLASIVNRMLDEAEVLIRNLAGVADDIAHDLRTPLTRARISLERGRAGADSLEHLQAVADQAILNIDHVLSIITALLRIREIEHTRRLDAFDDVSFADIVRDVSDFYQPIAEEKEITFTTKIRSELNVRGDRDLLTEALTNLVDNAIKFTPCGGSVEISVLDSNGTGIVRVSDSGPGIADEERDLVTRRFYRSDRSRHSSGVGLGLSLVSAIVKLHDFHFVIGPGPGFTAEIQCDEVVL
jgi:signal transduction histidine kinase